MTDLFIELCGKLINCNWHPDLVVLFRVVGNICPFLPSFTPLLRAELRENVIDRISKKAHTYPLCSRDHEITLNLLIIKSGVRVS